MTDQREFEKLEESSCSSVRHLPYVATDKPVMYLAVKCHGSNKTAPARSLLRSMFSPCSPPTINRLAKRDRSLWSKCRTITLWKFYLHSRVADFSWRCKLHDLGYIWKLFDVYYIHHIFCFVCVLLLYFICAILCNFLLENVKMNCSNNHSVKILSSFPRGWFLLTLQITRSWLHLKIVWRVLYSSYILFCMRVTFVLYMRNSVQFSTWKCENELFEV